MCAVLRAIQIGMLSACCAMFIAPASAAQPRPADRGYDTWSKQMKFNKSWIEIDWSAAPGPAR